MSIFSASTSSALGITEILTDTGRAIADEAVIYSDTRMIRLGGISAGTLALALQAPSGTLPAGLSAQSARLPVIDALRFAGHRSYVALRDLMARRGQIRAAIEWMERRPEADDDLFADFAEPTPQLVDGISRDAYAAAIAAVTAIDADIAALMAPIHGEFEAAAHQVADAIDPATAHTLRMDSHP